MYVLQQKATVKILKCKVSLEYKMSKHKLTWQSCVKHHPPSHLNMDVLSVKGDAQCIHQLNTVF